MCLYQAHGYLLCLYFRPWSASSASVGATNPSSMTSAEGMARIVALLLENGANIDAQDSAGRLVKHSLACEQGLIGASALVGE